MASSSDIGASFSNYTGNSGIGGGVIPVLQIDTRPLQQLGYYSMIYNQAKQRKEEEDAQAKIKELSAISTIDWQNAIPKEREEAIKAVNELTEYAKGYASQQPKNQAEKVSAHLDWQTKLNETKRKVGTINSRFIAYGLWNAKIDNAPTAKLKEFYTRKRDEAVNRTTINDALPVVQEYDLKKAEIPVPAIKKFDVGRVDENGNFNVDRAVAVVDMKNVKATSSAITLGMMQRQADSDGDAAEAMGAANTLLELEQSKQFTEAINQYKDTNGNVDLNAVRSKNPMLAGVIDQAEKVNSYLSSMRNQIKGGAFADKGKVLQFGMQNLDEADYQDINWKDGISPEELIQIQMLAKAPADSYDTKVDKTGIGLQLAAQDIDRAQLYETTRHNKATEGLARANFNLEDKKWQRSLVGSETQINGAMERAKRIKADLLKLADKNGVIGPDAIRRMNVEQLKYLGIEKPKLDEAGTPTGNPVLTPLTFDEKNEYAIEIVGDEVRVLKPAQGTKLSKTPSGNYRGLFDPNLSTNFRNVGVNILNEELKTAGTKELNAYTGTDIYGGVTTTTDTRTSTSSGSSSSAGVSQDAPNFTDEQLKKGAAKYKMSLSEYKKAIGL